MERGKGSYAGPGKVTFQDGKVVFIRHGSSFVRVSPNCLLKNPLTFNSQTPDCSVQSLKNDSQTSKTTCQSETNVKSQSTVSETLSPTISSDCTINLTPSTNTPSERLNKSNHTDRQSSEASSTICTPTSSHSTTNGSKSIPNASDSKFNCLEYELKTVATSYDIKSKSLPLPSKDVTVIYRLKPEGYGMKPKLPGEVVKLMDFIVVGLMLKQPLVINNTVLILKMLNGRNKKMSMLS